MFRLANSNKGGVMKQDARSYEVEVAVDMGEEVEKALRIWDSWDGYKIERNARRRMEARYVYALEKFRQALRPLRGFELAMVKHRLGKHVVQLALPGMIL